MTTKFYRIEKCENLDDFHPNWHTNPNKFYGCFMCENKGFIRGADITELINYIKILEPKIIPILIGHNSIEKVEE